MFRKDYSLFKFQIDNQTYFGWIKVSLKFDIQNCHLIQKIGNQYQKKITRPNLKKKYYFDFFQGGKQRETALGAFSAQQKGFHED